MTRLQKKCLIAAAGTHLLVVVVVLCSGFITSKPKVDDTQVLDVIPANVIEARAKHYHDHQQVSASGGDEAFFLQPGHEGKSGKRKAEKRKRGKRTVFAFSLSRFPLFILVFIWASGRCAASSA